MSDNVIWEIKVDPDWGTRLPRRNLMLLYFKRSNFGNAGRPDPIEVLARLARGGHEQASAMLEVCERFERDRNGWPNCIRLTKHTLEEI